MKFNKILFAFIISVLVFSCASGPSTASDPPGDNPERPAPAGPPPPPSPPGRNEQARSDLQKRFLDDGWDLSVIDTARDAEYLNAAEKDVFMVTNAARTNPPKFAELYVAEIKGYYRGNILQFPGEVRIQTFEGISAVNECYNLMINARGTYPVIHPSPGMSRAAADHVADQSRTGQTGHNGSDRSSPFDRMDRYGDWQRTAGENISYGYSDALRIVLQLLIDDGVSSRGHRDNIYNSQFVAGGVAIGTHSVYGSMCVLTYAGGFSEGR